MYMHTDIHYTALNHSTCSALDHDAWSSAPQLGTDLFLHDPLSSSGYPNNHVSADNCHKALVARQSQLFLHTPNTRTHKVIH